MRPEFALQGARAGEDILMSGITAFDLKAYDPSVTLAYHLGPDGRAGTANFDDDGDGNIDFLGSGADPKELGSRGSDDTVVSPNDPAYAFALASADVPKLGFGEFVDLCWGIKIRSWLEALGYTTSAASDEIWASAFSGYPEIPTPPRATSSLPLHYGNRA